jgi:hypothetical protein
MKITYIKDREVVTKEIPTVGMTTLNEEWLRNELTAQNILLCRVVEISDLPESLTSIGRCAFYGCSELIAITLPPKLTSIGDSAFGDCSGLTSITLPESLTSIGSDAFIRCIGLTTITLPASLTSIGGFAFSHCSGLTAITLRESLTAIGSAAFFRCSALQSGYILAPESLEIDIIRLDIPATTKIIRYDASVDANPIAAVRVLYQRIIIECKYTAPDKQKQVQQHLTESFLNPDQLLESALKSLSQLMITKGTIAPMNTIHDYINQSCGLLKGEIAAREVTHAQAQEALSRFCNVVLPHLPQGLFKDFALPRLSRGLSILMDCNLKSPFADQQSLPKKVDLTRPSGGGGGGGSGGGGDGNTLTP